ncbi:MAG: N-acyl-D-amino-acid deacylase family protein [Longimicrobiales bacterium]
MRRLFAPFLAGAIVVACAPTTPPDRAAPSATDGYDLVIENGRIVDGTGAAWFHGDVAIDGARIARITPAGLLRDAAASERIDVRGLVVAPGFIDIQSHSRGAFLRGDGRVVSKVTQGITTEIMGEAGTNAPLSAAMLEEALADTSLTAEDASMLRSFAGPDGFDAWLRAMEAHGVSPNIGSFVGASTIRVYGKGLAMGPATPAELDSMRKAVRWAMEDGAFGIGTALIYPPGNFASTEELVELAHAMEPYGGVYITHMRSEADSLLVAIDEAVEIGRRADVPVEIYHLKAAGTRNYYKMPLAIAKIDSARETGIDVQANMYPYIAGGTGLAACLPPWASAEGRLFENLEDAATRARIREEMLSTAPKAWEDLCGLATPEGVLLLGLEEDENLRWRGMRLSEVANALDKHWFDAMVDLLLSERQGIGTIYFLMSEENTVLQMRQPWIKFGTDAGGYDPTTAEGLAHPRAYGTFPRILGKYVREEGVMPLEEAVRKMSSAVATRLSIGDRGLLREGFYADIVIFDPETVIDRATFEDPHQLSVGVRHVLVNGVPVVRDGTHTGAKPGMIVRGPGWEGRP